MYPLIPFYVGWPIISILVIFSVILFLKAAKKSNGISDRLDSRNKKRTHSRYRMGIQK
jgi:hypothetical protein